MSGARQGLSKPRRLVAPSSKQKRESKGGVQRAREEKQVIAWGVSPHEEANVGLESPPSHLLIHFELGLFLRGKNQFPVHQFSQALGYYHCELGILLYIYFLIIRQTLSSRTKFQSRAITKRKMWQLSSPLSQVTQFDESPFLQMTAIVAIRILPNITPAKDDIKKEAHFLQNLFLSYLWKSLARFDLMGRVWHEAILFNLSLMIW